MFVILTFLYFVNGQMTSRQKIDILSKNKMLETSSIEKNLELYGPTNSFLYLQFLDQSSVQCFYSRLGGHLMAHMSVWLQLTKLQISLDVALIHFLFDLTLMFISEVFFWFFPQLFTFMSVNVLGIKSEAYKKYAIRNKALIYLVAVANNRIRPKALISSITYYRDL